MGSVKNLVNENAVVKMRELALKAKAGFFQTSPGEFPCKGRPMAIAEVDDEGKLWFFSRISSNKNAEIKNNNSVQIIFAKPDSSEFLCISGEAEIFYLRSKIEELWKPVFKTWFSKGKKDPDLSLICVRPSNVHYWDMKNNKAVTLLKNKIGSLVGLSVDDVVEGALRM